MSTPPFESGYAPPQAPSGPDTRPKKTAWTALGLAVAGIVASAVGLIPVLWVGLVSASLGALLLLAAFVFGIIGLASRQQGGKPLSIVALVLSVLGGVLAVIALGWSLVLIGLSAGSSSSPAPAPVPTETATEPRDDVAEATDEQIAAYLADVRPKVTAAMQQIDPSFTPEIVAQFFPDDALVMLGQAVLSVGVDSLVDETATGDDIPAEQMRALYEAIESSAKAHLQ